MAWLQNIFGTELSQGASLALLFVILIAALMLVFWLFRKIFGGPNSRLSKSRQPRLSVTDAAVVDDKRRLVLVRRDNIEHLVMIGGPSDIVIEQNIVRAAPVPIPHAQPHIPQAAAPVETKAPEPAARPAPAPTVANEPDKVETAPASNLSGIATASAAAGAGLLASASNASSAAAETVSTVSEKASDVVSNASSSLSGISDAASGTVSDTISTASDLGSELASDLNNALGTSESPEVSVASVTPTEPSSEPVMETGDNENSPTKTEDEMEKLLKQLGEQN
ncbi:MAG: hypothetical protein WBD01_13630 [Salaquimonas sp.]